MARSRHTILGWTKQIWYCTFNRQRNEGSKAITVAGRPFSWSRHWELNFPEDEREL